MAFKLGGFPATSGQCGCCEPPCSYSICVTGFCCGTSGYNFGQWQHADNLGHFTVRFQGPGGEDTTINSWDSITGVTAVASVSLSGSTLTASMSIAGTNYPTGAPPGFTWSGGVRDGTTPTAYPSVAFGISAGHITTILITNVGTGWTTAPTLTIDPPTHEKWSACYPNPAPGTWTRTVTKVGWKAIPETATVLVSECRSQTIPVDFRKDTNWITFRAAPDCCWTGESYLTLVDPDGTTYGPTPFGAFASGTIGVSWVVTRPSDANIMANWTATLTNPADAGCDPQPWPFQWCFCNDLEIFSIYSLFGNTTVLNGMLGAHYICCCNQSTTSFDSTANLAALVRTMPDLFHYSDPAGSVDVPLNLVGGCEWFTPNYMGGTAHAYLPGVSCDPYGPGNYYIGTGDYPAQIRVECYQVDTDGTAHFRVTKVLRAVSSTTPTVFCGATTGSKVYAQGLPDNPASVARCFLTLIGYATDNVSSHPLINLTGNFTEHTYSGGGCFPPSPDQLPPDVDGAFVITGS